MDTESPESTPDPTPSPSWEALEMMGRRIFQAAIDQHRCGELLSCFHEGGTATVDLTGTLVMVTGAMLDDMIQGGR